MRLFISALLLAAVAIPSVAARPKKNANVNDLKYSIEDKAIVYPETFEADTQKLLEGWYMKNYTGTDRRYEQLGDVETSDAEIQKRLASLPTVIELPFNPIVRNYIDRYTRRGRAQVAGLLGLSNYYMPIFEQALEAAELPLELKYLPVIESGLDPNAVSRHGATGLWQFMLASANGLGLEVNSLVDERRDPYLSSEAAARYLKSLYETYGDWSLAIAAYNCGPGNINKAIRRAGGDPKSHDFWSIYEYLSPETRGYVPMFIAANYVMNFHDKHNISPVLPTKPLVTDTVGISQRVHFDQISAILDIPVEELRILNPQYRADLIPGSPEKVYMLTLPGQQVHAYILSENDIVAYNADKYRRRETVDPGVLPSEEVDLALVGEDPVDEMEAPEEDLMTAARPATAASEAEVAIVTAPSGPIAPARTVTHTVVAGETLSDIAKMYDVDIASIKAENGLRRSAVRAGQQLKVTTSKNVAVASAPSPTTPAAKPAVRNNETASKSSKTSTAKKQQSAAPKTISHTVKSGESLYVIAKKHGVTVDELKSANNMKSDILQPGATLKVPTKGKVAPARSKSSGSKSATSSKKRSSKKRRR